MSDDRELTLRDLGRGNEARFVEEAIRPRVEVWRDPWVDWVSAHRAKRRVSDYEEVCRLPGLSQSPFCGLGLH